jgi:hypothetical protein
VTPVWVPDATHEAIWRRLPGCSPQVLRLCRKAGLVELGTWTLDGTKLHVNASKHKAMSYGRMEQGEKELAAKVAGWLARAEREDAADDAAYGRQPGLD